MGNRKGISLIELLVVLIISGIVVGGIYRFFIAQTQAYSVQDQVVEVQQNIRSAMEVLLRDLRMAGYYDYRTPIRVPIPIVGGDSSVTISYQYSGTSRHSVAYWRDGNTSSLIRQVTTTTDTGATTAGPAEVILENVDGLLFTYGVDQDGNGMMDDRNGINVIGGDDYVSAATVTGGSLKVVAVRVALTTRAEPVNPDIQKMVSPRTLISAVTLRNQCLVRK